MRILLLGFRQKNPHYETKRLIKELKKRGHEVTYALWSGVVFSFSKKEGASIKKVNGRDFRYFDYIIPRSPLSLGGGDKKIRSTVYLSHLYRHYLLIVDYINKYHKHVLNEKTAKTMLFYDKLFQHYLLAKNDLPILTSYLYTGRQIPDSVYGKFKTPYIAKSIEGSRGKQIFLIEDKADIPKLVSAFGLGKLLVQRYVPVNEDVRIIVIGNRVIGGMKRVSPAGGFRANVAQGAFTEEVAVTAEMEDLAKRAAKVFNAEFAGVDLIRYKGTYYILEVNIFPMFEGFEAATKINVAERLARYIERRYLWSIECEVPDAEKLRLLDDVYKIEKENFEEVFTKKELREELKKRSVIIVKKEDAPIAYLTHYHKGDTHHIARIVVARKYVGQRIGRRMLREVIAIAKKKGDKKVRATVPASYQRRQQSFRRAGFSKSGTKKGLFKDGGNGVVFEYRIAPKRAPRIKKRG
jgi:RimK family alpha-L-glutamate ligase